MNKKTRMLELICLSLLFAAVLILPLGCSESDESKFNRVLDKEKNNITERKAAVESINEAKYIRDLIQNKALEPELRVFAAETYHNNAIRKNDFKYISDGYKCPVTDIGGQDMEFLWLLANSETLDDCSRKSWRHINDCGFIREKLKTASKKEIKYRLIDKACESETLRDIVFNDTDVTCQIKAVSNEKLDKKDIRDIFFNHKNNKVKWAAAKRLDAIDSDEIRKLLAQIIKQNDFLVKDDYKDEYYEVCKFLDKFPDKGLLKQIVLETKRADFAELALITKGGNRRSFYYLGFPAASDFEFVLECLSQADKDEYNMVAAETIDRVFWEKFKEFDDVIELIDYYYKTAEQYKNIKWKKFRGELEGSASFHIDSSRLKNNPLGNTLEKYTEYYLDYLFYIKSPILNEALGPLGVKFTLADRVEQAYTMNTYYSDGRSSKQVTLASDTVNVKIINTDTGEIYVDNNRVAAKLEDRMEGEPDPFDDGDYTRSTYEDEIQVLLGKLDNEALEKVSQSHAYLLRKVAMDLLTERRNSSTKTE